MAIAKGSKSPIYWKEQTAVNTAPTGNWNSTPFTTEGLDESINTVQSEDIRPDRANSEIRGGNLSGGGPVNFDFGIKRSLHWIRHLLAAGAAGAGSAITIDAIAPTTAYARGTYVKNGTTNDVYQVVIGGTTHASVTATSPTVTQGRQEIQSTNANQPIILQYVGPTGTSRYSYTLNSGIDFPAFGIAFEKGIIGGDSNMFITFLDSRFNSLELTVPQETMVKANWGILYRRPVKGTVSGAGTPVALVDKRISGFDSHTHINDEAGALVRNVVESSVNITNGIQEDAYIQGFRERVELPEGTRVASGRISMMFTDSREYDYFKAETVVPISLSFVTGGQFLKFTFGECKLTGSGTPKISGQGIITQEFEWTAFKDTGANDIQVTAYLDSASY